MEGIGDYLLLVGTIASLVIFLALYGRDGGTNLQYWAMVLAASATLSFLLWLVDGPGAALVGAVCGAVLTTILSARFGWRISGKPRPPREP